MASYTYRTRGVCAREISFEIDGDTVHHVRFSSGCNGNTQGISALVEGMPMDKVIALLHGINCNGKGTSCPDQLANALKEAKDGNL